MDNFRKHPRDNQRQAIDSILNGPMRSGPSQRPTGRRPLHLDGLRTNGRRVDDFRRAEGYHAQPSSVRSQATTPLETVIPSKDKKAAASMLHMTLPGGQGLGGKKEQKRQSKKIRGGRWHGIRKWGLRSAMVFGALLLLGGGYLGIKALSKVNKVFRGGGAAAALQANVKPELLKGEGEGRINVLLLGRGGGNHDGPDLTDTILVASIDPINKTASLVSIPRDLWVTTNGSSTKINAVFANAKYRALNNNPKDKAGSDTAGAKALEGVITDVLGIPLHYYGIVDFEAFKQSVDTVGGVDITVPEELAVSEHLWDETTGKNYYLNVPAGLQHFDGQRALFFTRSRHTSARGDFDRAERQRLFIQALSSKVLSSSTFTNPVKISQLMDNFGDHIATDFSLNNAVRLMQLAKGIKTSNIKSIGLADPPNNYLTTGMIGSASVVLPRDGVGDYAAIQSYIRNTLRDPYLAKENAGVTLLNGTGTAGLATAKSDQLKSYGYNVLGIGDAPTQAYPTTVIVDMTAGKKPYTKNYLQKRFGVKATTKLPDATIQAGTADFVIILGQDATANSKN